MDSIEKSKIEKKLRILEAKKEQIFQRVNALYEDAKNINDKNHERNFKIRINLLESSRAQYHEVVEEVESLKGELQPDSEVDLQALNVFDDLYSRIKYVEKAILPSSEASSSKVTKTNSSDEPKNRSSVKLPRLDLPSFSGKFQDWPFFYHAFKTIHEDVTISSSDKLRFLLGKLEKNALALVAGFQPSEENYPLIWKRLLEKYQDKRTQGSHCLKQILNMKPSSKESVEGLEEFLITLCSSVEALKSLAIPNLADFMLLHIALLKLDVETVKGFELEVRTIEIPSFDSLFNFVKEKCKILQRQPNLVSKYPTVNHKINSHTSHSFVINEDSSYVQACRLCSKGPHAVYHCPVFVKETPEKRFVLARQNRLCINCLSFQHRTTRCKSTNRCATCSHKHHTTLHFSSHNPEKTGTEGQPRESGDSRIRKPSTTQVLSCSLPQPDAYSKGSVVLATASIFVYDKHGRAIQARALLDSASQADFISRELFSKLGWPKCKTNSSVRGIGSSNQCLKFSTFGRFSSRFNQSIKYSFSPLIIDRITEDIPSFDSCTSHKEFEGLCLADTETSSERIDVLLGASLFPMLLDGCKVGSESSLLYAVKTKLGYVIMGTTTHKALGSAVDSISCPISVENSLENLITRFWELESIPSPAFLDASDEECERFFQKTTQRSDDGRYAVGLPFKGDFSSLGSSLSICKRRFYSLEKRLEADPNLRKLYNEFMQDLWDQGHMSPAGAGVEGYYLPHLCVIRPHSATTKLRVVFDASAKGENKLSLNDILHTGPKLQADITEVLLSFRLFSFAVTADIKQMYRQINVLPDHRFAQKVLWRFKPESELTAWTLNTVTFGVKPAPFLALRVIRKLVEDEGYKYPVAAEVSMRDLYMDDLATSVPTEREAVAIYEQLTQMFKSGGFELAKWSSNSNKLGSLIPQGSRFPHPVGFDASPTVPILGLQWSASNDVLFYNVSTPQGNCTKRSILSTLARIFDPLGFLAPVTLSAKIIIKEMWEHKLDWDEPPPGPVIKKWEFFKKGLVRLSEIKIPRRLLSSPEAEVTVVGFCDASQKGYGAVVYLKSFLELEGVNVTLICAKSRVSPLRITSIPRLELCGAVLLAQLLDWVLKNYKDRVQINQIWAFTDSEIVLHWINSPPSRWATFVANRVATIQDKSVNYTWSHVKSEENPADVLSRGILPGELEDQFLWFQGPSWLKSKSQFWPSFSYKECSLQQDILEEKRIALMTSNISYNIFRSLIDNCSKYPILLRATIFVLKFVRKIPLSVKVSTATLNHAELVLIKSIQKEYFDGVMEAVVAGAACPREIQKLNPFLEDGLLRVGGRLRHANINHDHRHPILLPKRDHLVDLLIDHIHRTNLHTGPGLVLSILRTKYWILGGRDAVRLRLQKCNFCFRFRPKCSPPLMGDLPPSRVTPSKAFLHSGVDYAGPFLITPYRRRGVRPVKAYICLFICLSVKAIHLEVASDLSTSAFIAAFKRFISRRGPCRALYSDCGTNFIGAKSELEALFSFLKSSRFNDSMNSWLLEEGIDWKLNPPSAPHFGGIWEANIKGVKSHLRKAIGSQILTYEEFSTVITQIECLLNSRPLCPLSADPSDPSALTPAHFLLQIPLSEFPSEKMMGIPDTRLTRYQLLDKVVQSFWKRWHLEYLHTLQMRAKWCKSTPSLKKGTVVVVMDSNLPPLKWSLGVVEECFPGADNVIRVVSVRTSKGVYRRPAVKLCPLPSQ